MYGESRVFALETDEAETGRVGAVGGGEEEGEGLDGGELGGSAQGREEAEWSEHHREGKRERREAVVGKRREARRRTYRTANSITSFVTATSKLCVTSTEFASSKSSRRFAYCAPGKKGRASVGYREVWERKEIETHDLQLVWREVARSGLDHDGAYCRWERRR